MIRYSDLDEEITTDLEDDELDEYLEYLTEEEIIAMSDEDYDEYIANRKVES